MGLTAALCEEPRSGADRRLTGKKEALLVATACSSPPSGCARWTLELWPRPSLGRPSTNGYRARRCAGVWPRKISRRGARTCGAFSIGAEYVARTKDVLDLYAEVSDPERPVACLTPSPTQLIDEVRQPISALPGNPSAMAASKAQRRRQAVCLPRRSGCRDYVGPSPQLADTAGFAQKY